SAAQPSFFAMLCVFGVPSSKTRAQTRKNAASRTHLIVPPVCTSAADSSCISRGSRFSYRGSRDRTAPCPRAVFGRDRDGHAQQSRSESDASAPSLQPPRCASRFRLSGLGSAAAPAPSASGTSVLDHPEYQPSLALCLLLPLPHHRRLFCRPCNGPPRRPR